MSGLRIVEGRKRAEIHREALEQHRSSGARLLPSHAEMVSVGEEAVSLISVNYLLLSARSKMSSYFFAYLIVLWKQRKSEADLIRFRHF